MTACMVLAPAMTMSEPAPWLARVKGRPAIVIRKRPEGYLVKFTDAAGGSAYVSKEEIK